MRSVREINRVIDSCWAIFRRTCEASKSCDVEPLFREALASSREAERGHRRFMAHGPHGGYRISAERCARMFVMHHVFEGNPNSEGATWLHAAQIRRDCLIAYGLREALGASGEFNKAFECSDASAMLSIDYADDCARG